jgi:putative AbiEi antitoxin of type IV toxin-antitoxin system
VGRNSDIDREIARIAASQHGNSTRRQLIAAGLDDDGIAYRIEAGRLFRVHRGVYAVGRPPVVALERAAAAVLACGSGALLSHSSAMALWGMWKHWEQPFEVTVAGDRRPPGIRIHRCSTLTRRDADCQHGISVTSPARTVLDMAPRLKPRPRTRLINDSRRATLLSLEDLADIVARNPTHPGVRLLRPHLDNPQNPTRSGGEDDFPEFCERYDLPSPLMDVIVHGFEVDAYFPDERLIVELDGWPYHRDRDAFENDRDRDATMLAHAIPTVRITYDRIEHNPDREAQRLHTILRQRRAA